jgi:hypothetical protein
MIQHPTLYEQVAEVGDIYVLKQALAMQLQKKVPGYAPGLEAKVDKCQLANAFLGLARENTGIVTADFIRRIDSPEMVGLYILAKRIFPEADRAGFSILVTKAALTAYGQSTQK